MNMYTILVGETVSKTDGKWIDTSLIKFIGIKGNGINGK